MQGWGLGVQGLYKAVVPVEWIECGVYMGISLLHCAILYPIYLRRETITFSGQQLGR